MKLIKIIPILLSLILITFVSCEEEIEVDSIADNDMLFSYVADNYHVDFINESTYTGTYKWDFGDTTISTEENPSHDYARKGEYYVTLSITGSDGVEKNVFSRLKVDKNSDIDLEDDSFDDWGSIADAYQPNPEHECGVVTNFKYDYDSDYIYFYMRIDTPESTDYQVFDMMIDTDPSVAEGFDYSIWPLFKGAEVLIENGFSADRENNEDYFLDFANYDSAGTDWDSMWIYDGGETADAQIDGTYLAEGSIVQIEFAVSRTKIAALDGVDKIKIAAWASNPDWDENGWIPCKMPDDATGDTPLADGLVINME